MDLSRLVKAIGMSCFRLFSPWLKLVSLRFILASTEELHEKIATQSARIRVLEGSLLRSFISITAFVAVLANQTGADALRDTYEQLHPESADSHPLLADELLHVKAPLQRDMPRDGTQIAGTRKPKDKVDVISNALGSLSIGGKGCVSYFGHTASSWVSLL
jgi:hypothetical protein